MPVKTPGSSAGALTLISEASPSGTGTVTFASIAGLYRDLRILLYGRSTKTDGVEDVNIEFNGDPTAANYRYAYHQIYGAAVITAVVGDERIVARVAAANSPSNSPGIHRIEIPYYANVTFNKIALGQGAARFATSGNQLLATSHWVEWENNAAITQIDLKLPSGNWVSGTKVALYGLT